MPATVTKSPPPSSERQLRSKLETAGGVAFAAVAEIDAKLQHSEIIVRKSRIHSNCKVQAFGPKLNLQLLVDGKSLRIDRLIALCLMRAVHLVATSVAT